MELVEQDEDALRENDVKSEAWKLPGRRRRD